MVQILLPTKYDQACSDPWTLTWCRAFGVALKAEKVFNGRRLGRGERL